MVLSRCVLVAWVTVSLTVGACATQQIDGDDAGAPGPGQDSGTPEDSLLPGFDIPNDFVVPEDDLGQPSPDTGNPFPQDTGNPVPEDTGNPVPTDRGNPVPTDRGNPVPTDTGPRDSGTSSGCASATTCAACTGMLTCGWCAASGRCFDGTSSGPRGTTCAQGWAWLSSACMATSTDPCRTSTQCGDCTARSSCGWCASTRQCLTGTGAGAPSCPTTANNWAWLSNQCVAPTDPCRTSTGCGSCTDRGSCGWCNDSRTCHTGTSSGPNNGACRGGTWKWTNFLGVCL